MKKSDLQLLLSFSVAHLIHIKYHIEAMKNIKKNQNIVIAIVVVIEVVTTKIEEKKAEAAKEIVQVGILPEIKIENIGGFGTLMLEMKLTTKKNNELEKRQEN